MTKQGKDALDNYASKFLLGQALEAKAKQCNCSGCAGDNSYGCSRMGAAMEQSVIASNQYLEGCGD